LIEPLLEYHMLMGVLGWAFLGFIAGFIASKLVNLRGDEPQIGIILGAVGGVIGGWLFSAIRRIRGKRIERPESSICGNWRRGGVDGVALHALALRHAIAWRQVDAKLRGCDLEAEMVQEHRSERF
jgi:uncharacterized membrane protein YeaQ/YmgE (transglycosylase-associated protein family)